MYCNVQVMDGRKDVYVPILLFPIWVLTEPRLIWRHYYNEVDENDITSPAITFRVARGADFAAVAYTSVWIGVDR